MDTEVPQWLGGRERSQLKREEEDLRVRELIIENPRISKRAIAEKMGWTIKKGAGAGRPNVMKVARAMERLREKGLLR